MQFISEFNTIKSDNVGGLRVPALKINVLKTHFEMYVWKLYGVPSVHQIDTLLIPRERS